MHGRVQDNSFLRAFASAAPDMDSSDRAPLYGGAGGDDLSIVRVLRHEVAQKLHMIGIRVVRVEEGDVRSSNCTEDLDQPAF